MSDDRAYGVEILSEAECMRLAEGAEIGRLAVSVARHPDIFPINFSARGGTVFFATSEGTKLSAVFTNRNVAFEVDGYDTTTKIAWSVVIKGLLVEVDTYDVADAARVLEIFPWISSPKSRVLKIVPEETTGRRFAITRQTAEA